MKVVAVAMLLDLYSTTSWTILMKLVKFYFHQIVPWRDQTAKTNLPQTYLLRVSGLLLASRASSTYRRLLRRVEKNLPGYCIQSLLR